MSLCRSALRGCNSRCRLLCCPLAVAAGWATNLDYFDVAKRDLQAGACTRMSGQCRARPSHCTGMCQSHCIIFILPTLAQ